MRRMMSLMIITVLFAFSSAATAADQKKMETKKTVVKHHMTTSQTDLQKQAKISIDEAKAIALKQVPGTIKSAELENENGLVYSFDIKTANPGIEEVLVSAIDGSIVKVEHETAKKEAAEKKQEAREKAAAARKAAKH